MANFDSDYSVRLATLEALGGDTTKCYDSVYAIDLAILDAIEQGGGGGEGLTWNQIKNLLASSGVTEIVVNGDGESITLNYDLLNQIGQGGMDYNQIKSALAASGLTSILVLDGSGNTINMDYSLLDQIEPFDYAKVQSGLTNTGVTDILFDNGSGSTKVLDYDLVNQIGEGMDWDDVKQDLAESGVTDIKINDASGNTTVLDYEKVQEIGQFDYSKVQSGLTNTGVTDILFDNGSGATKVLDYDLVNQIGQGGGMDWNDVKNDLAQSGVTDILFSDGSGNTKNLDYSLVNQIGQGGSGSGDYIIVDSIDALSGITSPKGGMMAYVQKQPEQALRQVITIEGTGTIYVSYPNDSTNYYINLSTAYDGVSIMANNGSVRGYRGYTNNVFNKVNWLELQKESCLPYEILFNNGAKANLVSMVDGSTSGQYIYTFYVEKFNDAFPTITFNSSPVATSVTEETVTVTYNPKGLFQYNILLNKWFPYHIYPTYLTQDELDTVCQDVFNYRITCKICVFSEPIYKMMRWVNYDLQCTSNPYAPNKELYFGGPIIKESINAQTTFISVYYRARTGSTGWWMPVAPEVTEVVRQETLPVEFSSYMYMAKNDNLSLGNLNNKAQSLYIDAVAGSFTGTIYSTTIPVDVSGTTSVQVANMTGINNYQIFISENGTIRFTTNGYDNVYKKMETNADWLAFVYTVNGTTFKFYAAKIVDNGDNTFTVSIFKKDDVGFSFQSGQPYTWTEETNQTVTFKPHIYTRIRNISDTYLYKIA